MRIGRVVVTLPGKVNQFFFYIGNPIVTYPRSSGGLESHQNGEKSSKIDGAAREF